jgi:hypothetical protein
MNDEFLQLVYDLRLAQKNFFAATKHSENAKKWLNKSRELEKKVDSYLEENLINKNQTKLF